MPTTSRIALDWKKLFAFQQVDPEPVEGEPVERVQRPTGMDRIGAKIGDKEGIKKAC